MLAAFGEHALRRDRLPAPFSMAAKIRSHATGKHKSIKIGNVLGAMPTAFRAGMPRNPCQLSSPVVTIARKLRFALCFSECRAPEPKELNR